MRAFAMARTSRGARDVLPRHKSHAAEGFVRACYGKPGFMAPEQERDGIVTVRSDIFSLGVTFTHLFFPDDPGRLNVLRQSSRDTRLAGLAGLVLAMVQRDPSLRPPDMADVVHQLLTVD